MESSFMTPSVPTHQQIKVNNKRILWGILFTLTVSIPISSNAAANQDRINRDAEFKVFDGSLFKNKPDLRSYGIETATLVYQGQLWDSKSSIQATTEQQARKVGKAIAGDPSKETVILDIEAWPLKGDIVTINQSLQRYSSLVKWFRSELPNASIGYYSLPPLRDYWRAIKGSGSPEYRAWQSDNNKIKRLMSTLDASYPSLYTFYTDRAGWVNYAIANLKEAKRLNPGKPVYAFLWPTYHDSNALLKGQAIPGDYWALQLETVMQYADGLVIWGVGDWNENAEWWSVTKDFMSKI
jgi:hypothetical protein